MAEEAFDLRDKRHESVLKGIITSPTRSTEKKGHDIIQLPNYSHLILTSNSERVVPAGDKERRFLVLRVSGHRRGDKTYWDALLEDMASGGVPNLLHFLMQVDLREFDVTKPPQTEELRKQQEYNLPAELDWLMTKLESGVWLEGHQRWEGPVRKKELYRDYQSYLEKLNVRQIRGERIFHRFIVQNVPGAVDKQVHGRDQHDRPMVWMFPPLEACREAFDRARGWKHEWRELKVELEKEADIIDFPGKEVF